MNDCGVKKMIVWLLAKCNFFFDSIIKCGIKAEIIITSGRWKYEMIFLYFASLFVFIILEYDIFDIFTTRCHINSFISFFASNLKTRDNVLIL